MIVKPRQKKLAAKAIAKNLITSVDGNVKFVTYTINLIIYIVADTVSSNEIGSVDEVKYNESKMEIIDPVSDINLPNNEVTQSTTTPDEGSKSIDALESNNSTSDSAVIDVKLNQGKKQRAPRKKKLLPTPVPQANVPPAQNSNLIIISDMDVEGQEKPNEAEVTTSVTPISPATARCKDKCSINVLSPEVVEKVNNYRQKAIALASELNMLLSR